MVALGKKRFYEQLAAGSDAAAYGLAADAMAGNTDLPAFETGVAAFVGGKKG